MASTARTSLVSVLAHASKTPAMMRGPISVPCTCSAVLSRAAIAGSSLRFQSSSAASTSTLSTSAPPSSATISNNRNSRLPAAGVQPTPKGTQPVKHDPSSALALLRSQPSHYVIASLYQRRFLLTPRDLLTVPRLKDVNVGDVIRLDKIHEVGSRDYTLRATDGEFLRANAVHVRATVVEHTKGRMESIVKFKKRKGYTKTIKHKGKYTRLRIGEVVLGEGDSTD